MRINEKEYKIVDVGYGTGGYKNSQVVAYITARLVKKDGSLGKEITITMLDNEFCRIYEKAP